MLHHWYKAAEKFQTSRILLLDYSKAFNLVDHNITIATLTVYGVPDIFLIWIGSSSADRRQRVCNGEQVSKWLHLNGSVPQGSGLRPFVYVVMINDMSADCFMCHKFMDDWSMWWSLRVCNAGCSRSGDWLVQGEPHQVKWYKDQVNGNNICKCPPLPPLN